ncbi:hypothetical protein ABC347_16765 [Sphingomonas sp. 1P06PA]|uniref:hypothetical protein n=1 Tax=Sphingomonas sp. 1P06PA TaxID=554121 RepID=UPI0039A525B0
MRRALIAALLLAAPGPALADRTTMIRPIQPAARGQAADAVAVAISGSAATSIADDTEIARYRTVVADAVRAALAAGETPGIEIAITIDTLVVADGGAAFLNAPDRIAGLVELFETPERRPIGMLYIDIENRHPGLVGVALRGVKVRETLAREFAVRLAKAMGVKAKRAPGGKGR